MINSVRNAVLTILNKNNYGYISPADFNLLAANAQMEIYEEYFSNANKVTSMENLRQSGTGYSDIGKPIAEVLENFLVQKYIHPMYLNNFYYPSPITTGDTAYMISKLLVYTNQVAYSTSTATATGKLIDSNATFISDGINPGDIVFNIPAKTQSVVIEVLSETQLSLLDNIFPTNGPAIVRYSIYDYTTYSEAEKVTNNNISNLVGSNLTGPTLKYPAYSNVGELISMYPVSIQNFGAVRADYFRHPKTPKWTYVSLAGGEPAFDQSQPDYQDFELPAEDEYKLVTKILEYCGIVVRDIAVSQFGTAQQQHEQPSFSIQQ